jgi:hypothetical protein
VDPWVQQQACGDTNPDAWRWLGQSCAVAAAQIRILQLLYSLQDQFLEVELLGASGGFCQLLQPGIDLWIELNRSSHGRGWCRGFSVGLTAAQRSGPLVAAGGGDGRVPACVDPAHPVAG